MKRTQVTALVASKAAVKRRGILLEHLYRINVALGHKLYVGETKKDMVLYCIDLTTERRLLTFGAIAADFREQRLDLELNDIRPIEIKPELKPVFA